MVLESDSILAHSYIPAKPLQEKKQNIFIADTSDTSVTDLLGALSYAQAGPRGASPAAV